MMRMGRRAKEHASRGDRGSRGAFRTARKGVDTVERTATR